ncbi:hypothetical protein [Fluviicola sp.]|uniref:hypothetical protein n=1 Tax=Fluviicola sp. TaxID=1917219 RepID=UPI0031D9B2A4
MKKLLGVIMLSAVSLSTYSQEESGYRKFAVKFSPTQLAAGEFNFSYEQRLARLVSMELELGPTISQFGLNFGNQKLWQGDLGLWDFNAIDYDAAAAVGFHVSLAPRFYPASDDSQMKGLYLSPVFKFRQYNYTNKDESYYMLDNARSSINQFIFRFNMGLQFWPGDGNFCLDMYFGVGLGTFNITGQSVGTYENPPGSGNVSPRWETYRDNGIRINAITGIKLGFGK